MSAQRSAIDERNKKVKADTVKSDKEVADLEKEIAEKQKDLRDKIAIVVDENADIKKEIDRCDRICKRMDEFFA